MVGISNNTVHVTIHIIDPWYMEMQIAEYDNNDHCWEASTINLNYYKPKKTCNFENNWNLIKNQLYYLRIVIYDQLKQKVFLTNDIKIEVRVILIHYFIFFHL